MESFFKRFLFIFRESGKEKKRERNTNVWLPLACPPTGDLARNSAMCPDRESNQGPFGTQASVLNPLSHTSQGTIIWNLKKIYPKNQTHRQRDQIYGHQR